MKIKTSELIGPALDWAVAKCEGERYGPPTFRVHQNSKGATVYLNAGMQQSGISYRPSVAWVQGGPIIEREKLCVGYQHQLDPAYVPLLDPAIICWARTTAGGYLKYGPTPLIAAMRCYVTSKLGDEVEVPKELVCTS